MLGRYIVRMLRKEVRIFKVVGEEDAFGENSYRVLGMVPYFDSLGHLAGISPMDSHPDIILFPKKILDEQGCIMVEVVDENLLQTLRILYGSK